MTNRLLALLTLTCWAIGSATVSAQETNPIVEDPDKLFEPREFAGKSGAVLKYRLLIWCFHGDQDKAVPVSRSREMIAAIKKAGGAPKYTEYAGVGHDSWTQTYGNPEFYAWLFAQHRGSHEAPTSK